MRLLGPAVAARRKMRRGFLLSAGNKSKAWPARILEFDAYLFDFGFKWNLQFYETSRFFCIESKSLLSILTGKIEAIVSHANKTNKRI
jgi:hypothetical protein